jgi:hypothetical protein
MTQKLKRLDFVDNLFDDEFIQDVSRKYHSNLFRYGHVSNGPDAAIFWVSDTLENGTKLINCKYQNKIFDSIQKHYKFKVIPKDIDEKHIYINGQTINLEGEFHIDSHQHMNMDVQSQYTILYMINYHDENIEGFETNFHHVEFKAGRVVIFNSYMPHRGLAPTVKNKVRMTLTWKGFDLEFDKDSPIVL